MASTNVAKVETVRSKIAALQQERARVSGLPVPLEEATARLDAALAVEASRFRPPLVGRFIAPGPGSAMDLGLSIPARADIKPWAQAAAVLAWAAGDRIRELYLAEIEEALAGQETMATEERTRRLAELDAELLELELKEEALVVAAEAAGEQVHRRADADPRAVLEWDEGAAGAWPKVLGAAGATLQVG